MVIFYKAHFIEIGRKHKNWSGQSFLFAPYCKLSMCSASQHYFVCVNKSNKET